MVIFLILGLTGCIPHIGTGPAPAVAVAYDGSQAAVLYVCQEMRVSGVRVQRVDDTSGGSAIGPILWHVTSTRGTPVSHVEIGETPTGFDVITPLKEPLPPNEKLWIVLETTEGHSLDVDTRLSDIRADEVAVYYGYMSRPEFENQQFNC